MSISNDSAADHEYDKSPAGASFQVSVPKNFQQFLNHYERAYKYTVIVYIGHSSKCLVKTTLAVGM